MSKPGTKGPKKTVNEGAMIASTDVEQQTAEVAKADALADIDDIPVDTLEPKLTSAWAFLSSITVHIFGSVSSEAYNKPERIEMASNEIPGS